MIRKKSSEKLIRDIKRNTRRKYSAEEKIRIVIEGRSEQICRDA
jgi:transposase